MGALVIAAGGVAWWQLDDGPYTRPLVRFDDDRSEANRYTNLDDRAAQLSVGSPDGHDLVVQWRAPDGHGWTAPETVWIDGQNLAIENTLRHGGGTVAIVETYTPNATCSCGLRTAASTRCCGPVIPGTTTRDWSSPARCSPPTAPSGW